MNHPLRARVVKGRLHLDEPTDLPEGSEVELQATHNNDWMSSDDEERLHDELAASEADLTAGRVHSLDEIIADFKARRA